MWRRLSDAAAALGRSGLPQAPNRQDGQVGQQAGGESPVISASACARYRRSPVSAARVM